MELIQTPPIKCKHQAIVLQMGILAGTYSSPDIPVHHSVSKRAVNLEWNVSFGKLATVDLKNFSTEAPLRFPFQRSFSYITTLLTACDFNELLRVFLDLFKHMEAIATRSFTQSSQHNPF